MCQPFCWIGQEQQLADVGRDNSAQPRKLREHPLRLRANRPAGRQPIDPLLSLRRWRYRASHGVGLPSRLRRTCGNLRRRLDGSGYLQRFWAATVARPGDRIRHSRGSVSSSGGVRATFGVAAAICRPTLVIIALALAKAARPRGGGNVRNSRDAQQVTRTISGFYVDPASTPARTELLERPACGRAGEVVGVES
jgi:hypothetical protein